MLPCGDDTHVYCRQVSWELYEGTRTGKPTFTFYSSEMSSDSSDKMSELKILLKEKENTTLTG